MPQASEVNITRDRLRALIASDTLRHGKMLVIEWPRLRDKYVKNEDGERVLAERAGEMISRRLILRNDWTHATPSGSFIPKNGIMFNVESQEKAAEIRAKNDLALFLSLEGLSHPFGEKDHPVNVPLSVVSAITDTRDGTIYVVTD